MAIAKGYAATDASKPLAPFSFERREPGDDDVLIDIKYCGVCHSDIHQARNEWGNSSFPMVPGHEIAGIVTRGRQERHQVQGRRPCRRRLLRQFLHQVRHAAMSISSSTCRASCRPTTTSRPTASRRPMAAIPTISSSRKAMSCRIPDNLPLDATAPLLCAGITLYSPLRHWKAGPGKKVAIVGMGGLGHMGVKLAHAMGADVTVLSQSLSKKEDGLKFGADDYYATSDAGDVQDARRNVRPDHLHGQHRHRLECLSRPAEGRWQHGSGRRAGECRCRCMPSR